MTAEQIAVRPDRSESAVGVSSPASGWSELPAEYRIPDRAPSLDAARAYCERLVRTHYENFAVATWFLPARLRPHFASIYAYCRIADDLGDEVGDPGLSLALLDEWEAELDATYLSLGQLPVNQSSVASPQSPVAPSVDLPVHTDDCRSPISSIAKSQEPRAESLLATGDWRLKTGFPRHPVFVALRETILECTIPRQPFADLLTAFRQDQRVTRYETFADLLGYCRFSANPVGRLVLYACGYTDQERQELSDSTCTALQLANFWQDITLDYAKGRIYLPLEDLRRFGVTGDDIARRNCTPQFVELMRFQVERAREWFAHGLPLACLVDRELALDIELFSRGGQEILHAIEGQGYDVLQGRPALSRGRKLWLLAHAWFNSRRRAGSRPTTNN